MTTKPNLVEDLEDKVQTGSSEKRADMLRRITDLFVANAARVTEEHAAVFDDVFELLIKEIEDKAMLELSTRMSSVDNAPERLIRRLANDDSIEISGPVLAQSSQLGERDLIEIARTKGQAHLAAIAGRAQIDERVTEVLVQRGDMTVARKVAANGGARFSDSSLRSLVDRATDDSDLANAVARRRELPPQMFRHLLTRATDQVRQRLLDTARPGTQKAINNILAEISLNVEKAATSRRNYSAAQQAIREQQKQGGVTAEMLVASAKALKIEEMVVVLSTLTGVSVEVIDRFLDDASDDPLLILCKAIDLEWNSAAAVLAGKLGLPKLRESRAEASNKKYRKLTTYSAQRVLRFWQAREKVARAG